MTGEVVRLVGGEKHDRLCNLFRGAKAFHRDGRSRTAFPLGIVALGDASYSLYLFHPYVLKVVDRTAISFAEASFASVCAALLYIGLSLLLAITVYRHFERPVSRLLRARLLGRAAAPLRPAAARAP